MRKLLLILALAALAASGEGGCAFGDFNIYYWNGIFNCEVPMERIVNIHIEKLPEGVFLATSEDVQGLVAQGRTFWETLEIARDVARKLLEAQGETAPDLHLKPVSSQFDYPLVLEY